MLFIIAEGVIHDATSAWGGGGGEQRDTEQWRPREVSLIVGVRV
jgi:hypothetical protein